MSDPCCKERYTSRRLEGNDTRSDTLEGEECGNGKHRRLSPHFLISLNNGDYLSITTLCKKTTAGDSSMRDREGWRAVRCCVTGSTTKSQADRDHLRARTAPPSGDAVFPPTGTNPGKASFPSEAQ